MYIHFWTEGFLIVTTISLVLVLNRRTKSKFYALDRYLFKLLFTACFDRTHKTAVLLKGQKGSIYFSFLFSSSCCVFGLEFKRSYILYSLRNRDGTRTKNLGG